MQTFRTYVHQEPRGRREPFRLDIRPARLPESREWAWLQPMVPPVDVVETTSHIVVRIELPQHDIDDVDVTLANDILTVVSDPDGCGPRCRRVALPQPVREDGGTATLGDGVLQVILRKKQPPGEPSEDC